MPPPNPSITLLAPDAGIVGAQVTITGNNFGGSQAAGPSTVTFNGVLAVASAWSNKSIVCTVPAGASDGPVVVTYGSTPSNGVNFSIVQPPSGLNPDPFDTLLSHVCSIYRIKGGNPDKYGIVDQTQILVLADVPCRMSTLGGRSPHPGTEWRVLKQLAIADYKILMRPQAYNITPSNWVTLEQRSFDIVSSMEIRERTNPYIHHLEIFVREIQP
jgi:hypothetical protein